MKNFEDIKKEVLEWFHQKDDEHRQKNTPYYLRRFFARRIANIERGRELRTTDRRWIKHFGTEDFIKRLY